MFSVILMQFQWSLTVWLVRGVHDRNVLAIAPSSRDKSVESFSLVGLRVFHT